jgi:hypothetical protein
MRRVASSAVLSPRRATALACCANSAAVRAASAFWRMVAVICSSAAAVCSRLAAWFSVRRERLSTEAAISLESVSMLPVEAATPETASCRRAAAELKS